MNINDIFAIEQYDEAYAFVQSHEYTTIEDLGNGQYQIIEIPQPTEDEKAKKERERLDKLCLTKREVFLGLKRAKNIMPEQIRANIKDEEALIEFDYAEKYYRGNPLIDIIGEQLGITPVQLDNFFETNDYKELI